ncbi:MAG TPA: DUF2254 family protein [Candidatus Dormibacteraeota bacterium]|jgi:hypothetical protein|nr:DUF2254 family protein [Candidatus Dormibacteraeota bacterium]
MAPKTARFNPNPDLQASPGWVGAGLSGFALIAVAAMLVVFFGFLDWSRSHSFRDFITPDPAAAAGTLGLVGGAEGVCLSIVILVVVFGIQMTSSRYSPRIIGLFTTNPLNAVVLGFALASILYTFLVRAEIKNSYVPMWSVGAAEVLAVINFAIVFPYIGYIFAVMRAETLVNSIRTHARKHLARAVARKQIGRTRNDLLTSINQVTDIAFGSVQLGDMPVCLLTIGVLGDFLAQDYIKVKGRFGPEWYQVGHAELPGDSDQILAEVNRAHTWVEYTVLSSFVHIVGLTPVHRKEAVHAIAVATRDIGLAAIDAGDHEVAELCVRFFNTYMRAALNQSAPTFASATMNEYRRFAIGALEWRPDLAVEGAAHVLRYGRHFDEAGMPAIFGAAAEDVADLAIEAQGRDPEVTRRLALLLVRNLLELIPNARPIGLNGLFKAVAKLTFWAMAADAKEIVHILVEGIAAAPPDFVDAALDRMEVMQNGLFWEVNERVVAFDWVEEPLRAEIPRLRTALRRAKASGRGPILELDDPAAALPVDLVQPVPGPQAPSIGASSNVEAAKTAG